MPFAEQLDTEETLKHPGVERPGDNKGQCALVSFGDLRFVGGHARKCVTRRAMRTFVPAGAFSLQERLCNAFGS